MSELSDQRRALHTGDAPAFSALTEPYRRELQVYCYRILGSVQDAEDLVQETLLRAWRKRDTYQGRASVRAWLYKIATHACFDALDKRSRRMLPMTAGPASDPQAPFSPPIAEPMWLEPLPDDLIDDSDAGPEARYSARESVRLAFLIALQALPPRQRAVLILSDVLDWRASEVADLLEVSVSAVNSALHRARTTLTSRYQARSAGAVAAPPDDARLSALLGRYVHAWENADVDGLAALLKEDVTLNMPPSPSWYQGRDAIRVFMANTIFGSTLFPGNARGRWRLMLTRANGQPAFAVYLRGEPGTYTAFGIQALDVDGERIAGIVNFGDPALVTRFGLPPPG
ncbi:MAG TPA: sigma-70 family RNA polymerase sigma factor [Anaerolineae bacterium]|nr:sigma-70 family RNA polymerase sigma factor [Anaerolineae bacterium]